MKFNVHLYVTVHVEVKDVEADTPETACERAEHSVDLNGIDGFVDGCEYNYAEGIEGALIDHEGDPQYTKSRTYSPIDRGRWQEDRAVPEDD